ncbi:MAG: type II toxin-antitoxin system death-on-curing family toxin [Actinomycetes bacterium]
MRYLTFVEALVICEFVTGFKAEQLVQDARIGLLESALQAPKAGFGDVDIYLEIHEKASALCWHIAKNHPLIDGNKRVAWMSTVMFCSLNGYELKASSDAAVQTIISVADGSLSQKELEQWIQKHLSLMN